MAARKLSDFEAQVDKVIKDEAHYLNPGQDPAVYTEIDQHIHNASEVYSRDVPLKKSKEYNGDGTANYTLPTDWLEELSSIIRIEYPSGDDPPIYIEQEDYVLYRDPTNGLILKFLKWEPSASQTFVMEYTTEHSIGGSSSTIHETHFYAICNLAASYCLRALAARFAQHSDSSMAADAVAYRDKTKQYTDIADKLELKYLQAVGKSPGDLKTKKFASTTRDYDTRFITGHAHLTHPEAKR